jgi:hypothetical protein
MEMRRVITGIAIGVALCLAVSISVPYVTGEESPLASLFRTAAPVTEPGGGIAPSPGDILEPEFIGDIPPFEIFEHARFAINGVALRDMKMGGINLSGPPPGSAVLRAYLYWQWACLEEPQAGRHDTVRFKQVFPGPVVGGPVVGTLVGVAPNPCWCGNEPAFTYRADVTPFMSPTGGGTYGVIMLNPALGSRNYSDPWGCAPPTLPLLAGAALVVIYESSCEPNGIVMLYDAPLPNFMFMPSPGISYNLVHPPVPQPLSEARWAQASCDGQTGWGYMDAIGVGDTNTFINGGLIAGPGSLYNDSDFNGSNSKPLPQLFDTSGHDVFPFMEQGAPFTNVTITSPAGTDCLIIDLNILMFW